MALCLVLLGLNGTPASARVSADRPASTHSAVDQTLQSRLAERLSRATASHYGVVVDVEGLGRVASMRADQAMRPASTQKLFTTLPLLLNRADDRLVTDVEVTAEPVAGKVDGDLVVRASADPSLLTRHLDHLARQVANAGVRRVTGHLTLDIGALPLNTRQPGWKYDFVPGDIGPLSPFPVRSDTWRRDAAYLRNPTAANLQLFRTLLSDHGVRVTGSNRVVRSSTAGTVVARHQSNPLHATIAYTLRQSDNFYAESLLAVAGGHPAVNATARSAGVTDTSKATDGSGLSYDDRQTPRGEVTLLGYAHGSPAAGDLLAALPVGCRTGTLKHRFCHTEGAGKVFAKTGTLSHTSALAGYTTDALGRWVTFSIVCGGVHNTYYAEKAMDRAVLVLRRYARGG